MAYIQTPERLRKQLARFGVVVDSAKISTLCEEINKRNLDKNAVDYFLANVFHECNYLRTLTENLNYSTIERLRTVFPSFFKYHADDYCAQFIKNPQKLANLVYGGRFENDNNGDGWKYRGRGLLMLTFKGNYRKYSSNRHDLVKSPELLEDFKTSCDVCLDYYTERCVKTSLESVRRGIGGSLFGIKEVANIYEKIKTI